MKDYIKPMAELIVFDVEMILTNESPSVNIGVGDGELDDEL